MKFKIKDPGSAITHFIGMMMALRNSDILSLVIYDIYKPIDIKNERSKDNV